MYFDYVKEREDLETLCTEQGFALYRVSGDECYLKDIYIKPEFRKKGVATTLADSVKKIAKERGCRWMTGSISPPAHASHDSLLVLLAYGMKVHKADKDILYMVKEI